MTIWRFSLIIDGPNLDDDELLDALFEAGCDDALFGGANGVQCADFHRETDQVEDAVLSAIAAVESVGGLKVVELVERELVSEDESRERSEQTPDADAQMFTALARAVEARHELRKTPADRRARIGQFVGASGAAAAGA
ncbi:MAG: hypothetical protein OXI41_05235 [Chloroflexota bacterium]|nr:hypothetical protein [Chloroflexota bacterium]MDE2896646.1 hypothetical protein [Chloroflexota bacterium]